MIDDDTSDNIATLGQEVYDRCCNQPICLWGSFECHPRVATVTKPHIEDPVSSGINYQASDGLLELTEHVYSENGGEYSVRKIIPHQALGQSASPNRMRHSSNESELGLDILVYGCVQYWCSFDLLGRFLSIMGPAPTKATISNFYLPLTTMYNRWCAAISFTPPSTFSCLWKGQGCDKGSFYLGASIAKPWHPGSEIELLEMARRARFNMLKDEAFEAAGFRFENRSLIKSEDPMRLGEFSESYPLAHMLK